MGSYDSELNDYLSDMHLLSKVAILDNIQDIYSLMNERFPFYGTKIDFESLHVREYKISHEKFLKNDVLEFVQEVLANKYNINLNTTIIYFGDDLLDKGYKTTIKTLKEFIGFSIENIPQHHYIVTDSVDWCLFVEFENNIYFGFAKFDKLNPKPDGTDFGGIYDDPDFTVW